MPLREIIPRFLVVFALVFGGLIFPWPGWDETYGAGFRAAGQAILGSREGNRIVIFEAHRETKGFSSVDTQITLGNRALAGSDGRGPATQLLLGTRSVGWLPTALVIALIAATPMSWPRRLQALAGGLVLVQLFILFSVAVYIWNESTNVALVRLSPFWKQVAEALEYTLITQLGISFTVPVLIWIVVSFRQGDLVKKANGPRRRPGTKGESSSASKAEKPGSKDC